jgi:hypothetical protein
MHMRVHVDVDQRANPPAKCLFSAKNSAAVFCVRRLFLDAPLPLLPSASRFGGISMNQSNLLGHQFEDFSMNPQQTQRTAPPALLSSLLLSLSLAPPASNPAKLSSDQPVGTSQRGNLLQIEMGIRRVSQILYTTTIRFKSEGC